MKMGKLHIEMNQDLFYLKLRHTIDDTYKQSSNFELDSNYVRLLSLCSESRLAFQQFYRRAAKTMIEFHYPENMQMYLDRLLCDIRVRQSTTEEFYSMYSDDLYFHVQFVDHSCSDENTNDIVEGLLVKLKSENFLNFVILTTHFKTYRHLLKWFTNKMNLNQHEKNFFIQIIFFQI